MPRRAGISRTRTFSAKSLEVKVFVDTNVLVAAYATRGLCSDLLRLILAQHELVVSRQVLDELERALRGKIGLPEGLIAEILATLAAHMFETEPDLLSPIALRDFDDEPILAAALAAGAAALVTGDADLLDAAPGAPLPILSTRAFWLQQRGG